MGEGRRRCRSGPWDEGAGGLPKGHFHIPVGMVMCVFLCFIKTIQYWESLLTTESRVFMEN